MASIKNLPELKLLKSRLSYDKDSGELTWIYSGKKAGYIEKTGYISIRFDGKLYRAHRLAWFMHHGVGPAEFIDHIDRNKSNNSISNLREANKSENEGNCGPRANNKLGIRGVFKIKSGNYSAQICIAGKRTHLGVFDTPAAAAEVYASASRKHFGEFSNAD